MQFHRLRLVKRPHDRVQSLGSLVRGLQAAQDDDKRVVAVLSAERVCRVRRLSVYECRVHGMYTLSASGHLPDGQAKATNAFSLAVSRSLAASSKRALIRPRHRPSRVLMRRADCRDFASPPAHPGSTHQPRCHSDRTACAHAPQPDCNHTDIVDISPAHQPLTLTTSLRSAAIAAA